MVSGAIKKRRAPTRLLPKRHKPECQGETTEYCDGQVLPRVYTGLSFGKPFKAHADLCTRHYDAIPSIPGWG